METIYVTGHKNPDMDSICSALAYANLKNLTDPMHNYKAIRCSHIGDTLRQLLQSVKITPPPYKADVIPKVSDVMLTSADTLDASISLSDYAKHYKEGSPSAIPIFDNNKFYGLLSVDDIAVWLMEQLACENSVKNIPTIRELIGKQGEPFSPNDLFDDAKTRLLNSKQRGFAVMDEDKYVGFITRRCFFNEPKYNLILVDHNEPEQSIKGIEKANVIEIIDHHRLNAVKTDMPLFIDAEPLGSTCTIVYQLFLKNGIRPNPQTAKILFAGLISDTLILKSPTTTKIDIESAHALACICDENIETFGQKMFGNVRGLNTRNSDDAIASDFKIYTQNNVRIGIGQCEVTTLHDIEEYTEKYLAALENMCRSNALNWTLLMITDVIKERSVLLSTDFRAEKHLPYESIHKHVFDMPGVMSRKKQLLPEILHAVSL